MESQSNVIRLGAQHVNQVVDALVSAFEQDPIKIRLSADSGGRRKLLRWLLGGVVRYTLAAGEVFTDPDINGAACWLPPGRTDLHIMDMIRYWGWPPRLFGAIGIRQIIMAMEMEAVSKKQHAHWVPGQHWYLFLLGVSPKAQGQGIGRQLISPVLARAQREHLPCYLETQTERNVRFYRQFGFEVVHCEHLHRLNLPIWFMKRDN